MPTPPPLNQTRPSNGFWAFLRVFGWGINVVRLVIINLVFFFFLLIFLVLLVAGIGASRHGIVVDLPGRAAFFRRRRHLVRRFQPRARR